MGLKKMVKLKNNHPKNGKFTKIFLMKIFIYYIRSIKNGQILISTIIIILWK